MKRKTPDGPPQVTVAPAPHGLFRNAITEADGVSVNVGYLALFWLLIVVLGAIPLMIVLAFLQLIYSDDHRVDVQQLGVAIGAVCTGFGAALGALGLFLMGDRRPQVPSTSVSMTQTTVP